jgi:hypothetical protein
MARNLTEAEKIRLFTKEHYFDNEFYIPPDYEFLSKVANTDHYLREYFEWKGKNGL